MVRRPPDAIVGKGEMINVSGARRNRGRPKNTLIAIVNKDLIILNLIKHIIFYISQWWFCKISMWPTPNSWDL